MFDLEEAIQAWKRDMTCRGFLSDDNAQELEEHLRETVAELAGKGLTEQEAFVVGKVRIGDSTALHREYGKVHGGHVWRGRVLWMLVGYVGGRALSAASAGLAAFTGSACSAMGVSSTMAAVIATMAAILCWTVLLLFLYRRSRCAGSDVLMGDVSGRFVVGLCTLLVVGHGMAIASKVYLTRTFAPSEYGTYAMWSSVGATAVGVCVVAACLGLLFALKTDARGQARIVERP